MLNHAKYQDHRTQYNHISHYKNNIECPCVLPIEVTADDTTNNNENGAERDDGFCPQIREQPAEQVSVDHHEDGSGHRQQHV